MTAPTHAQRFVLFGKVGDKVGNVWHALTRPHPSITDIEMRRQSQLMAGLTFMLGFTTILASILLLARSVENNLDTVTRLVPNIVLLTFYYFLNRAGHYRLSAALFVIQNFVVVHAFPLLTDDNAWLQFASMNLILSAILMPIRVTVLIFVASMVAQIGLGRLAPRILEVSNVGLFVVYMITASMVMVFMHHRNRLERDRQRELQDAIRHLLESEAALERRVEERTRELVIAKERAERADQVKSQFLASMSHELRTPLNAILNFTEMMSMGLVDPVTDKQKDLLDKSVDSGKHLLSLINDVLDVAKMQSGMMTLFVEEGVDLRREVDTVFATAETLLGKKPIKLTLDIHGDLPVISGDKRRIRQVLLNLLSNAIKFTEEGSVTLSARQRGEEVLFTVADTGPGISLEDQGLIFQPFIQTESGIRHGGGTGLGLPISRWLVEAHGGKLWVESNPSEGAVFSFTLPLKVTAKPEGE